MGVVATASARTWTATKSFSGLEVEDRDSNTNVCTKAIARFVLDLSVVHYSKVRLYGSKRGGAAIAGWVHPTIILCTKKKPRGALLIERTCDGTVMTTTIPPEFEVTHKFLADYDVRIKPPHPLSPLHTFSPKTQQTISSPPFHKDANKLP